MKLIIGRKRHLTFVLFGLFAFLFISCTESDEQKLSSMPYGIVGADTHLYLTCNATGWNLNDATRLSSSDGSTEVFELSFSVAQQWMVTGFDNCVFLETNELNGWGTSQTYYSVLGDTQLVAPTIARLTSTSYSQFTVQYPSLGDYKVKVNMNSGTFWIEDEQEVPACAPGLQEGETCLLDDMETGSDTYPDGWATGGWHPLEAIFDWEEGTGRDGTKALSIEHPITASNDTYFKRTVVLDADTIYQMSAWVQATDVTGTIGVNLWNAGTNTRNDQTIVGTTADWTEIQMAFETDENGEAEFAIRLGYSAADCTGKVLFDDVSISRPEIECEAVYEDSVFQNDPTDANRFNIVFLPSNFSSDATRELAIKQLVGLDPNFALTDAYGLMQIPPYDSNTHRFNFWFSGNQNIDRNMRALQCQTELPNRIIPLYIHPFGGGGYSLNRAGAYVEYCPPSDSSCNPISIFQGAIHEMSHTIPCLADEYVNTDLNWDVPVEYELNIYPSTSYEDCMTNAPWAGMIGDGCGEPGIIDCIDTAACPLPISSYNERAQACCLPGTDCWKEIGCFEGARYHETDVWRPTAHNLMRSHWWELPDMDSYFSSWHEEVVNQILAKGPAIGRTWSPGGNYTMDCNLWRPTEFAPDI